MLILFLVLTCCLTFTGEMANTSSELIDSYIKNRIGGGNMKSPNRNIRIGCPGKNCH
jgi:hypothetical protein